MRCGTLGGLRGSCPGQVSSGQDVRGMPGGYAAHPVIFGTSPAAPAARREDIQGETP
jgi:hypothetical protein